MPPNTSQYRKEVGFVTKAVDYLLTLEGLPNARMNDIILSDTNARALITGLERDRVEAVMLDPQRPKPGTSFSLSDKGLQLSFNSPLFGRAFNALGVAYDGGKNLPPGGRMIDLDTIAPGIDSRKLITDQFITGMTLIDTLLPIGRGQRELLFGEPRSGKTTALLDLITYQQGKNIMCIYVALGKAYADITQFTKNIREAKADSYTIILAAPSSEAAPLIAITPAVSFSLAEYFRSNGKDVLLILDDLGTHAKYLREMGLLAGRVPGRESYPPDLFYQYSHHIERAGNFTADAGGGSITLIPVIETDLENFTSFVPTTLMSITDGHILFTASLRAQGRYPAIEPDRSVTRVGHQTQSKMHRIVADKVRSLLVNYHELERYSRFGSELSIESQTTIKRGLMSTELLRQEPLKHIDPAVQILLLSLVFTPFLEDKDIEFLKLHKSTIISTLTNADSFKALRNTDTFVTFDELIASLKDHISVLENVCRNSQS